MVCLFVFFILRFDLHADYTWEDTIIILNDTKNKNEINNKKNSKMSNLIENMAKCRRNGWMFDGVSDPHSKWRKKPTSFICF